MSRPLRLFLVAAARPNFMKVAPLLRALQAPDSPARGRIECQLVHTGQHYDPNMSDIFFRELGIPAPDFNLGVGGGSHAEQTAQVMLRFETLCQQQSPDGVVVVGDVNSTLACALVAAKLRLRLAHVEAGLRSFDRTMPEEINRIVTEVLDEVFGLGPLEPLLRDSTISDILVTGPKLVYVEQGGKLHRTPIEFQNNAHLLRIIEKVVSRVGRRVDMQRLPKRIEASFIGSDSRGRGVHSAEVDGP